MSLIAEAVLSIGAFSVNVHAPVLSFSVSVNTVCPSAEALAVSVSMPAAIDRVPVLTASLCDVSPRPATNAVAPVLSVNENSNAPVGVVAARLVAAAPSAPKCTNPPSEPLAVNDVVGSLPFCTGGPWNLKRSVPPLAGATNAPPPTDAQNAATLLPIIASRTEHHTS